MKMLVSGASGLVGSALIEALTDGGNEVRTFVRREAQNAEARPGRADIWWDVQTGEIDEGALNDWNGPDAVVHLAGENIAAGRWTEAKKRRIRESRVQATERLAATLAKLGRVKTFVSASAIGFYGDRGDEILTEASSKGTGFLADVCELWEASAQPLAVLGTRVVHLRFGMILSAEGGALAKMLPIFRAGLGGRLGNGKQWVSWITRRDVVRAIEFALRQTDANGVFNVVAPNPVRNEEITRELGRVLGRPTVFPAPAFALRIFFGELADALLLSSERVLPERLIGGGFDFEHPTLRDALESCLKGSANAGRTKN